MKPFPHAFRVGCIAAVGLLLVSCGDSISPEQRTYALGQDWVDRTMSRVQSRIEATRGARFTGPVRGVWIREGGFDSLVRSLSSQFDLGGDDPSWAFTERTMVTLGMVDSLGQWGKASTEFDQGSILGFYLPLTRTLYVFDTPDTDELYHTVVHEMVHALQDQRFGLDNVAARAREVDEDDAITALIEGEAEYVTAAVTAGDPPVGILGDTIAAYTPSLDRLASALLDWSDLQGFPLSLTLPTYVPYAIAPDWISRTRVLGGWKAVDSLFLAPPKTTREVLWPTGAKSVADWNPGGCPAVSGTWRPLQTGRLGVVRLAALVNGHIPSPYGFRDVLDAWSGDRFWTFESDSGSGLLWALRFDGAPQARIFAQAWWDSRSARRLHEGLKVAEGTTVDSLLASTPSGRRASRVLVRGGDVLVADGFSVTESDALVGKLAALPARDGVAGRAVSATTFGGGAWKPPRPPIPVPRPPWPGR